MTRVSPVFLLGLGGVYALGVLALAVRLWSVQVTGVAAAREDLALQATRRVRVPGLRGRILDARGRTLADCRASRCIVCRVEALQRGGKMAKTVAAVSDAVAHLAAALGRENPLDAARIERHVRLESARPLVVFADVDDDLLARFCERNAEFPGFDVETRAERVYSFGAVAAHALGYVGRDKLDDGADDERAHFAEQEMKGRTGLEGFYDRYLAGVVGEYTVLVDARGFVPVRGGLGAAETERQSANGLDLVTTLDARLQLAAERALKGMTGACVVLDPNTGDVLALASAPAFDPNRCVPRLPPPYYAALTNDARHPLINRAVTGTYTPGSIFKPITSLAALHAKRKGLLAGWTSTTPYDCSGTFRLPGLSLRCWDHYGHGPIALEEAIEQSCNAYFANLGWHLGTNALFAMAREFGLGARTGVDLGGEAAGGIWAEPWHPGDLAQTAIGQGKLLVTPIQMAVVCAALANGGKIYRPRLHARGGDQPAPAPERTVPCTRDELEIVRRGMRAVVETGTGRRIGTRFESGTTRRWRLGTTCAGKTGTAEVGRGATRHKNAWVIAFAPYDAPTLAIAMVVERGDSGGRTTAPRVYDVLKAKFGESPVVAKR